MKRSEFLNDVDCVGELLSFCWQNNCDVMENVIDDDTRDEYINDSLVDLAREYNWQDLYRILSDYDDYSGYSYYYYDDGYGEYRPLSENDFEEWRDEVLRWADDQGDFWDPEDDEEDEEDESGDVCWDQWSEESCSDETEDNFEVPDEEDCSVLDMLSAGVGCIRSINEAAMEQARQEDRLFMEFTEIPF